MIGLLCKLFERHKHERSLSDLSYEFESEYGSLIPGLNTFKEIAGTSIEDFIIHNKTGLKTRYQEGTLYVYGRPNSNESVTLSNSFSSGANFANLANTSYSSLFSIESEFKTAPTSLIGTNDTSSDSSEEDLLPNTSSPNLGDNICGVACSPNESSDQGFQMVALRRKKKRKKEKLPGILTSYPKQSGEGEATLLIFEILTAKEESEQLKFMPSEDAYRLNNQRFMLDLVSMWNVPHRSSSYILFGIDTENERKVGLTHTIDQSFFDGLFNVDWCTGKPVFKYHAVISNHKQFGLLEIMPSEGHGTPCLLIFPTKDGNSVEGMLYVRRETQAKHITIADPDLSSIFQWFSPVPQYHTFNDTNQYKDVADFEDRKSVIKHEDCHCTDPKKALRMMNNFKLGGYVLITGDITQGLSHADAISMLPLLAVFDFDAYSRDRGLLSSNEDFIKKKRKLQINTWREPKCSLSESSTLWSFLCGRRDVPDSRLECANPLAWSKKTKQGVRHIIDQVQQFVADYTTVTVLFLWPKDIKLVGIMYKFFEMLFDIIEPALVVLCIQDIPQSPDALATFRVLKQMYTDMKIVRMPFTDLFLEIKTSLKNAPSYANAPVFELPGIHQTIVKIDEEKTVWLRENFEVLFLTNPYPKLSIEDIKLARDRFYRGGCLHWSAVYACTIDSFLVERDVFSTIITKLKWNLDEGKTCTYTILHEPGSGGSSLGQRILWHFRGKNPCLKLKMNSNNSLNALIEQLEDIYDKTQLCMLLMIDGEEDTKVFNILRSLRSRNISAVLLHIKRYNKQITAMPLSDNKAWLKGAVSVSEARTLAMKFSDRAEGSEQKIKALELMGNEAGKGVSHSMYEFGLTTYLNEYTGITSLVRGYLDVKHSRELTPGHNILGYLSLVYYYGHSSLPMQFFSSLLNLSPSHEVTIKDFPHNVSVFLVPDDQDGRKNNVRLCHYLIAKEILEQLLTNTDDCVRERKMELDMEARRKLGQFCINFIDYASTRRVKKSMVVSHVLTRTFIFRDCHDDRDNTITHKKPKLPRAIKDIVSEPPLFTERFILLQKLADAFPSDPSFHAHLGRYYAFCRKKRRKEGR